MVRVGESNGAASLAAGHLLSRAASTNFQGRTGFSVEKLNTSIFNYSNCFVNKYKVFLD